MERELSELLHWLFDDEPRLRVVWPEYRIWIKVEEPEALRQALRGLIASFRQVRPDDHSTLNTTHIFDQGEVWLQLQHAGYDFEAPASEASPECQSALGVLESWGGETEVEVSGNPGLPSAELTLPILRHEGPPEPLPVLRGETWEETYRLRLDQGDWRSLRRACYRYTRFAIAAARWGRRRGYRRALVPAVGLAIDPWVFAAEELECLAFDVSTAALGLISRPESRPELYSEAAKEAWDARMCALYYGGRNPQAFAGLPDIAGLGERVGFIAADWAAIPLGDASVDVIFATNALPRGQGRAEREAAVREWIRVLRPGGLLFACLHNAYDIADELEEAVGSRGWREAGFIELSESAWRVIDDPPEPDEAPGYFQILASSG